MEIIFGGIASLFFGVADFLGGEGAKRASAATIVLWSGAVALPLMTITALIVGGDAVAKDYLLGVLAGSAGALGLVALFAGLSRGQTAAVAPVSAVVTGLLPVLVAIVVLGERPSALAWLGVAIGVPAILLCAWAGAWADVRASGVLLGLAAGAGFGSFTVIIRETGPDSGLLPLIASRGATFGLVLVLGLVGLWKVRGARGLPVGIVVGNAILDTSANVALLLALRAGSLALAAVASSFYPAVTVFMARVVNSEHLHRRQILGLGLTVAAVTLIAVG